MSEEKNSSSTIEIDPIEYPQMKQEIDGFEITETCLENEEISLLQPEVIVEEGINQKSIDKQDVESPISNEEISKSSNSVHKPSKLFGLGKCKTIHNVEIYICEICSKTFSIFANLKKHLIVHSEERPHKCVTCNKTFKRKDTLKLHERFHSNKHFHLCTICNRTFSTKQNLNQHLINHTVERPHKCNICNKAFITETKLKQHENVHTRNDRVCTVCNKTFTTKQDLSRHEMIHTGERPFKCGMCDKAFRTKQKLKVHEMIHTGSSSLICAVCDKTFTAIQSLVRHKRNIHGEERPAKCEI